jgi:hypothetical protein
VIKQGCGIATTSSEVSRGRASQLMKLAASSAFEPGRFDDLAEAIPQVLVPSRPREELRAVA